MNTLDALGFFGSKNKLAKAAGVRVPSVYNWGVLVPEGRAQRLVEASGGALVYDKNVYDQYRKQKQQGNLIHENHHDEKQGCYQAGN